MRKTGIFLGIAAGILVLAGVAVWSLVNPNRHREFIQSQIENQLGRKVTLGEMSLGLFPLRFQVKDTTVSEDPSIGQERPFISAGQLDIRVSFLPLLQGNIQVDSLELQNPRVELVRNKAGTWNFATLGPAQAVAGTSSESASPGAQPEFVLEQLAIVDGQVGITDLQRDQPRAGYDHIDLTILHFSPGKPFSFDLSARVQGEDSQQLRLKGEAGPVSQANPADTPFHGTFTLAQVEIENLLKFLNTDVVASAGGALSGEGEVGSELGEVKATGRIRLEGARFNNLDIGYPISLDYALAAGIADELITIESASMQVGQTPLAFSGTISTATSPPNIDLRLKSGDVAITELARLASAFGVAFAPGTSVNGRISADVRIKGPASMPQLTGTIAGRELQVSGQGIPQPVQVKAIDVVLTPTAIESSEFTATSGKTSLLGKFSILQYASKSPSLDLALKAPGATLPEIQSIAKAYGVTGLDQLTGEGSLNFDLRAKGSLQSLSTSAATRALNGTINIDFSPLRIAGFDTAHELGKLGGFVAAMTSQGQTDILRVAGRIVVKDGIAQTDDLTAQLGIGRLMASGTADLPSEALNLKLSTVFSKEFSDRAGSTRAGGLLNIAMTNSAGELVLPAIVTGSFQQPRFAPDLKAAAQLQKQKFLPSLENPAAAIRDVIGVLRGRTAPSTEQPAGEKPSIVKGILDVLGGKKNDPTQK